MEKTPKYSVGDIVVYKNDRIWSEEYFVIHKVKQSRSITFFHEFSFRKKNYYSGERLMGEARPGKHFTDRPRQHNIINTLNIPEEKLKPLDREVKVTDASSTS